MIFSGETITVTCVAVSPTTGQPIIDATATVDFYAPPKNPVKNTADRAVADKPNVDMAYDANIVNADGSKGAYVAYVSTAGWAAGKWYYKVTLTGANYNSWEYGSVKINA